jgi:hypothetical protein
VFHELDGTEEGLVRGKEGFMAKERMPRCKSRTEGVHVPLAHAEQ